MESIKNCDCSDEYDVFVHIDAPNIYRENDKAKNIQIKDILNKYIDCFKRYTIEEEKVHHGLAKSVIESVSKIIAFYGKVIVIEDDLVLSEDCLNFLDDALNYYEKDSLVWSVTGYTPPLNYLDKSKKDIYFSYRGSSLAWGTWENRWKKVDWDILDYKAFYNDYRTQFVFCRGGYDLPEMLREQMCGLLDSWAVRWCYCESKENMMTVYPCKNRVTDIDLHNGTHDTCMQQKEMIDENCKRKYIFSNSVNKKLVRESQSFYKLNYKQWINEYYKKKSIEKDRFEAMFHIMDLWKKISETGHSISEYFYARNYNTIAIYGKGRIGDHIEKELQGSNIKVAYFIDRNKNLYHPTVNCYSLDEKLPKVDCVVITVVYGVGEIKNLLESVISADKKTIIEVIKDQ